MLDPILRSLEKRSCASRFVLVIAMQTLSTVASSSIAFNGHFLPPARVERHIAGHSPLSLPTPRTHGASSSTAYVGEGFIIGAAVFLGAFVGVREQRRVRTRPTKLAAQIQELPKVDRDQTKKFRKDLQRSEQYFRFGKSQMDKAMEQLKSISGSDLVARVRENGFRLTIGDITFVLAESYGFCWGVERSVAMAYEARNFFPDKNIWVTNEIIHNPLVNNNLANLGMKFVPQSLEGLKDYSAVSEGDVVVLPAFGASVDEMLLLKERNVQIVDTTCPWVSKVWNSVEKTKAKGHTVVIHGQYNHEETIATKSIAKTYLVLKNMADAEYVANYIFGNGNREEFMETFKNAMSEDFDPDEDLAKVGVANQTTMMKGETELIGKLFERTMIRKYGPQEINNHFVSFNTICDATQERQDAMYKMFNAEYEAPKSVLYSELEDEQRGIDLVSETTKPGLSSKGKEAKTRGGSISSADADPARIDICLVVGGFNSSNTTHLVEIALEESVPAYHVDCAERIGVDGQLANSIQFKPLSTPFKQAMLDEGLEVKYGFVPDGPVTVGITSGASTPDSVVGEVMQRLLKLRGLA